jgi:hypothetical protein
MSLEPVTWPPTTIGGGDANYGYWLGGPAFNALVVAPKSTEVTRLWAPTGNIVRGTTSTTDGLANTNTLYAFGSAAHPAAYYCKTLTTGGYTTWYLPANKELTTLYSNKSATPFATANSFLGSYYWSSTENIGSTAWEFNMANGSLYGDLGKNSGNYTRATRRYAFPTATIGSGDSTVGYWLGTAGDGVSKLVIAPKSTETSTTWGSYGTTRNTISTTNGLANTNTLYAFGSSITTGHPAAYYCKTLTTGGYNTWYLPAKGELNTLYSNKSATPFATANSFVGSDYWSSTEGNGNNAWIQHLSAGSQNNFYKAGSYYVRAVRRST